MTSATELHTSDTGLVYRVRRGAPHSPLILMLHGLSGDENVMWLFEQALPKRTTVVSPRALFTHRSGGYSWSRAPRSVPREFDQVDFNEALETLQRFASEMIRQYEADPQRVIVMGFSQGAALSYALSLAEPELFCGAIALAGFLLKVAQSKDAFPRHGYLILHGLKDEDVPIEQARQARSVLEARGAPIEYHEYPVGHKVSVQGMKDIAQWLKKIVDF